MSPEIPVILRPGRGMIRSCERKFLIDSVRNVHESVEAVGSGLRRCGRGRRCRSGCVISGSLIRSAAKTAIIVIAAVIIIAAAVITAVSAVIVIAAAVIAAVSAVIVVATAKVAARSSISTL